MHLKVLHEGILHEYFKRDHVICNFLIMTFFFPQQYTMNHLSLLTSTLVEQSAFSANIFWSLSTCLLPVGEEYSAVFITSVCPMETAVDKSINITNYEKCHESK